MSRISRVTAPPVKGTQQQGRNCRQDRAVASVAPTSSESSFASSLSGSPPSPAAAVFAVATSAVGQAPSGFSSLASFASQYAPSGPIQTPAPDGDLLCRICLAKDHSEADCHVLRKMDPEARQKFLAEREENLARRRSEGYWRRPNGE